MNLVATIMSHVIIIACSTTFFLTHSLLLIKIYKSTKKIIKNKYRHT